MTKPALTALRLATGYVDRHWSPIPVPVGSKKPELEGWSTLRVTKENVAQYFNGHAQNIGILLGEPSGWLTDVDLDCAEACRIAPHLLPAGPIFGRKGNPSSHRLFKCRNAAYERLTDPAMLKGEERAVIIELRATGEQSIFPGSVHKSGEPIEWERDGEPPELRAADLTARVRRIGAAVLLMRYGWREGQRDELATALCGALLRKDWPTRAVDEYVAIIAAAAGDANFEGLGKAARLERSIRSGKRAQGMPRLGKLLPRDVFDRVVEWLDLDEQHVEAFPTTLAIPAATFNKLDIPKREAMVENFLLTQTLSMLYAARGLGKTMLALDLAVALARGTGKFLEWRITGPRRVLYVDGEMAASELQERLRKFCGDNVPDRLDVLSSEKFYHCEEGTLNLALPLHQERFTGLLDALKAEGRNPEFIVLDNKSALSGGTDENSNSEQDAVLEFLRHLRHRGHAVLLIHHAGKSGDQRGASRTEDFLDLVIKLEAPKSDDPEAPPPNRGAAFKLSFTKNRGLRPDPPTLDLELMEDMDGTFTWAMHKPPKQQNWLRVAEFIRDHAPGTQAQIADALGLDRSNVSGHIKKLRERQMLVDGSLELTPSGRAYVDKARPKAKAAPGGAP